MRALILTLALLAPLLAPVPASAAACDLSAPRLAAAGYYVEVRSNGDTWVYQERNGIPGLQRGSVNALGQQDPCVDDRDVVPDQAIF